MSSEENKNQGAGDQKDESKPITFDFSKGSSAAAAAPGSGAGATDTPFNTPVFSAFGQGQLQDMLHQAGFSTEDSAAMFINTLSPQVKRRVTVVQGVQAKLSDLRSDFENELKQLIKKYEGLYAPLYEKRAQIVSGEVEPTDEQVKEAEEKITVSDEETKEKETETETEKQEEANEEKKEEEEDVKGIPDFWLRALRQHPALSPNIQENDDDALKYLTNIKGEHLEEGSGFKLEFHFAENPYFTNKVLTKTYYIDEDEFEDSLEKAEGTKIDWKPNKNLTERKVKKAQVHKRGKQKRTVIKTEPCDSFFNFFNPPDLDQEDPDEEYAQDIEELMEVDLDLGRLIKDAIIPRAVDYYLGKVNAFPGLEMAGEEFDFDDEGDDDEDDEGQPRIRAGNGEQPECKQQ